jgi:peptide/nickel transport system substrate-binding protein
LVRTTGSLLLFLILFASCKAEQHATTAPAPEATQSKVTPRDGGRLVRRLEGNVQTLNYLLHTTDAERYVLSYLHTPLVDLDQNLQPIAATAARWEIGDGGRSYTFFLDPRARFTDNTPVLASDVLFTIGKIVDEQSPQFAALFDALDRSQSKVIDDKTVRFVFKEARAAQLHAFNVAVLPEHVYGKGSFKNDFNDKVVGNGPYELSAFERGQRIELKRRASDWRERPRIDSVVFRVIADDAVAWMAVKRGDVDEMRVKPDIWAVEKDRPEVRGKVNFLSAYTLSYNCIAWNTSNPILASADVRRALAMAYDRPSIIQSLYRGEARPVTGPFTPDQPAYNSTVPPIAFDPAGASSLLERAGWRDTNGDGVRDQNGRKLIIELLAPSGHQTAAQQSQVFQAALKSIGVTLDIRELDGATMFDRIMNGNYQAAFMSWTNDPETDLLPLFHSTQLPPAGMNIVRYRNAEVDKLIEEARSATGADARRTSYHRIHELLARDQPYLWTVQVANKWAVNKRVENVQVSRGTGLFFWYPGPLGWWLRE